MASYAALLGLAGLCEAYSEGGFHKDFDVLTVYFRHSDRTSYD